MILRESYREEVVERISAASPDVLKKYNGEEEEVIITLEDQSYIVADAERDGYIFNGWNLTTGSSESYIFTASCLTLRILIQKNAGAGIRPPHKTHIFF